MESERPQNFPPEIPVRLGTFQNWSKEITVTNIWIATARTPQEVVTVVNWAKDNGYKVRASGRWHCFSPTLVDGSADNSKTILVDTTKYLTKIEMTGSPIQHSMGMKVQTGALMEDVLLFAENNGCGMYEVPAPGKITLGGVLAVGAHGAGIPALGETEPPGLLAGTISNLIISLTAVVWNDTQSAYVLKTFPRSDPETKAFLIHLGRAFITEATIMVGKNYNLRCQSFFDVDSKELYAKPAINKTDSGRTFSKYLDKTGRIEVLSFGNIGRNWIKLWTVCPKKPLLSREVSAPYNYVFGDLPPEPIPDVYTEVSNVGSILTPELALAQHAAAYAITKATFSNDIWGASKNTMLYVEPNTLRETASGHVVLTKRENVQKVISILAEIVASVQNDYAELGQYPISGHIETRVTSLDRPVLGEIPCISPIRPIPNYPEYNLAVWLAVTSQIHQCGLHEAMMKIESRIFETFSMNSRIPNPIGVARVEWTKGYAYTKDAGWRNETVLKEIIRGTYSKDDWNFAINTWNIYDPKEIFMNDFLEQNFVAY